MNRDNVKWCARLISIVLVAAAADVLVVLFMRRPFPFAAIVPGFVPILVAVFVILPMSRARRV